MARTPSKYDGTNPNHVTHILRAWHDAPDAVRTMGTLWYPVYGRLIAQWAHEAGYSADTGWTTFAALSPQARLDRNIDTFKTTLADGHAYNVWQTEHNRFQATMCLWGMPEHLSGDKVTRFYRNFRASCLADVNAATIDSHACAIAENVDQMDVKGPRHYAQVERAYQAAAIAVNVTTRSMQATTWLYRRNGRNTTDYDVENILNPDTALNQAILVAEAAMGAAL